MEQPFILRNNFLIGDATLYVQTYMREIKKMSDGYLEAVEKRKYFS